jgi:LacI family transcriptional regulator
VLIANSLGAAERDVSQIRLLKQRRVDGFILSLADEEDPNTIAELKRLDRPFVLLDRTVRGIKSANSVLSDHAGGVRAAIAHLAGLGHRHVGFIGGYPRVRPSRERVAALNEACARHGITASVSCGRYTAEYGEQAAEELLAAAPRAAAPTAILAGSNQILVGVLKTLRRLRLAVPADMSLITCDDLPLSEFLFVDLATIHRDVPKLGVTAAELLLATLHGEPAREILLPVAFRPGASCARPRRRDQSSRDRSTR